MTFLEILPHFLEGKKIRAINWEKGKFITNELPVILSEYLNLEWELYPEPTKNNRFDELKEYFENIIELLTIVNDKIKSIAKDPCKKCNGSGQTTMILKDAKASAYKEIACEHCDGTGNAENR